MNGKTSGILAIASLLLLMLTLSLPLLTGGDTIVRFQLIRTLPFIAAVLLLGGLFCVCPTGYGRACVLLICISGIVESVLGIVQVINVSESQHPLFCLTGSLGNPGPYGGLIAIAMSVALVPAVNSLKQSKEQGKPLQKILGYISLLALCLGALVLPASQSRAGWLAFAVAALLYAIKNTGIIYWLNRHTIIKYVSILAILAAVVWAFTFKLQSALGRFYIWWMDIRAIVNGPFFGYGLGYRSFAFGEVQADYFASGERPLAQMMMACCPVESFNEFLSIGMCGGVFALVLALAIAIFAILSLYKRNSPLAYGLVAWVVFACFSYPLSIPHLSIMLAIILPVAMIPENPKRKKLQLSVLSVLLFAVVTLCVSKIPEYREQKKAEAAFEQAREYVNIGSYSVAARSLRFLEDKLFYNYWYLYEYGMTLFNLENYEKSISILKKGAAISCDPAFHNLIGRCYEAMEDYENAEREYRHSINMVPCRLYSRSLLMNLKTKTGNYEETIQCGRDALVIPVNPLNTNMQQLYMEIQSNLDSLLSPPVHKLP